MNLDRIWAGWRTTYLDAVHDDARNGPPDEQSLFERIYTSGETDEATHIVWHGQWCFAILNAFPYGSGHLMVLPKRKVATLEDLSADEHAELWEGVRGAVVAIKAAYDPDGVNVGINLGRGAGAGVPDHLHVHVLPRWVGDTNFMTAVAETRVLPEPLDATWKKVRAAWPTT